MDITITITAAELLPDVYKITGYTGKKAVTDKDIDRISSDSDDANILGDYFMEACNALADIFTRTGYASAMTSTSVTYALTFPANWKSGVLTSMTKACKTYIVNYMCRLWFNLAQKGEVAYYEGQCDQLADTIRKFMYERVKPVRS